MRLRWLSPLILLTLGCSTETASPAKAPKRASPRNVIALFDSDTRELLDDAAGGGKTVVEAFRVIDAFSAEGGPGRGVDTVGRYTATMRARLPRDISIKLASALTDDRTYVFEQRKRGFFVPDVAFRFSQRSAAAEILLCFSSSEMQIRNAAGQEVMAEFEPGRDALVRMAKLALPNVAEIQALTASTWQPGDGPD